MKHIKKIQELLEEEFRDYSIFNEEDSYEIHFEEEYKSGEIYLIEFNSKTREMVKVNDIKLKAYTGKRGKDESHFFIAVELGEDNWYDIETFEPTIKHFWQALLWQ